MSKNAVQRKQDKLDKLRQQLLVAEQELQQSLSPTKSKIKTICDSAIDTFVDANIDKIGEMNINKLELQNSINELLKKEILNVEDNEIEEKGKENDTFETLNTSEFQ